MQQRAKLFPVGPRDYDVARGVIKTLYGEGVRGRLEGLKDLVRTARGVVRPRRRD